MSHEIYEAACRYTELGLAVIPLKRETNTPPIRYKQIERDGGMPAAELRRHFADDRYNIGLLTGSASRGVMGLDLDNYRAYKDFESRHPKLSRSLPYAISPRGWHFYFLGPEGERRTLTYHVGERKRSSISHIKGDGNFITLAPSWRPDSKNPDSRKEYRWVRELPSNLGSLPVVHPQILLPQAQLAMHLPLAAGFHPITPPLMGGDVEPKIWLAAHAAAVRYQPWGPGSRDETLFSLARCLRGLFGIGSAVTVEDLRPVFATWHAGIQFKSYVEDKDYLRNWRAFCNGWRLVRLDNRQAFRALAAAYQPAEGATGRERLWALCITLAAWDPQRHFYLAGELAAQFIGVSQQSCSKWLREFCVQGRLRLVAKHSLYRRTAATYQVVVNGA